MPAIYPGSFDPVTHGHIDIARRAAAVMGHLVVAVLDNPRKTPLFSVSQRVGLLREVFSKDSNIEVDSFGGLLVDYAAKKGINTVVRGLRSAEDFAQEQPYAVWNRKLSQLSSKETLETLFLVSDPALAHVSGSIVKEVYLYKPDTNDILLSQMVPAEVIIALRANAKGGT